MKRRSAPKPSAPSACSRASPRPSAASKSGAAAPASIRSSVIEVVVDRDDPGTRSGPSAAQAAPRENAGGLGA